MTREERISRYYDESIFDVAVWLVDTEDELEMWKAKALRRDAEGTRKVRPEPPHSGVRTGTIKRCGWEIGLCTGCELCVEGYKEEK